MTYYRQYGTPQQQYSPDMNPFEQPQRQQNPGGSGGMGFMGGLRANYDRLLDLGRRKVAGLPSGARGALGSAASLGGRALPFLGLAAAAAGPAIQAYDTLTNQNRNFDIGGQLAGNALGAGAGMLTGPLAPIAVPLLSYLGGEIGKNVNLIPDDTNRQLRTEQQRLERTLQATDDPIVQQTAIQRSRERSQEILGAGGGSAPDRSVPTPPEFNSEVLTPMQQADLQWNPSGIVQRGKDNESERMLNQWLRMGQDTHRRRMEYERLGISATQAANLLQSAGEDADSHRRFLVGLSNSRGIAPY